MNQNYCTSDVSVSISTAFNDIGPLITKANGLLLLNAILVAIVVGIGTCAPHYRHHPLISVLFVAATTLFLPIISSVAASATSSELLIHTIFRSGDSNSGMYCTQYGHIFLIFVWAGLVVMVVVNASVVVAGDAREGRNISPPKALTGAVVWTTYLTISTLVELHRDNTSTIWFIEQLTVANLTVFGQLFFIMYTKLLFKYYAFYKAKHSFANGRSPSLVNGYMDQLQQLGDNSDTPTILKQMEHQEHDSGLHPPALIVMGENNVQVHNQPRGYRFKWIPGDGDRVVTLDRVWKLHDMDMLQSSAVQPKYLGFSFSLFKLIRCRFAKYTISSASFTKAQKFFRYTLIEGADGAYERVFGVVADELSFLHDYYNSSQPIYYYHHGLVIFNIFLSLYSILYCIYLMVMFIVLLARGHHHSQILCSENCGAFEVDFAGRYSDVVPLYLVAAVLVFAEARDILFYICSNWTKVSLTYHYVNQASWKRSPIMKKCIGVVFKYCSSKPVNNWDDKIRQCRILHVPTWLIAHLPRRLQRLHNRGMKVKLPTEVKSAIFKALQRKCQTREPEGSIMYVGLPSSPVSTHAEFINNGGKSTAYTILAWHIATTVLEIQQQQQPLDPKESKPHKVAATHLSRYCAYLVACCPELLPDNNDQWCKRLYEDAKMEATRVLSGARGATAPYTSIADLLITNSTHSVLNDGASLGKQLVDSGIGWEPLARFWSEMILYVAPSENLEAQAEAVARGGELITLLWAMLSHSGIDRK